VLPALLRIELPVVLHVAVQVVLEAVQQLVHDVGVQAEDEVHGSLVQLPRHAGGHLRLNLLLRHRNCRGSFTVPIEFCRQ